MRDGIFQIRCECVFLADKVYYQFENVMHITNISGSEFKGVGLWWWLANKDYKFHAKLQNRPTKQKQWPNRLCETS